MTDMIAQHPDGSDLDAINIETIRESLSVASHEKLVLSIHGDSGVGTSEPSPAGTNDPSPAVVEPPQLRLRPTMANQGPDQMAPSDSKWTVARGGAVKLAMGAKGAEARMPVSVVTMLRATVKRLPDRVALAVKRSRTADWTTWTYKQYYDDVWRAAKSMIKLGLEEYHGVGIVGFNSPEWLIADLAAIFAGGLATGIYTTNSPEACQYVAESCEANIIVVENDVQLQKILKVRASLPHLKAIVQYNDELKDKTEGIYTWAEFMAVGRDVPDSVLEGRIRQMALNKCCTLIYTSGTTGNPKAVMLSHDNLTWTSYAVGEAAQMSEQFGEDVMISYLPLSHVAAQIVDIFCPILYGASVYFALPDALKGSLGHTMKEVRPTAFLGVPRVWEKMQEKMVEIGRQNSGMKRKVAVWAKGVGLQGSLNRMNGSSVPWGWGLANALVFKKVRAALGLDRCKICISAAAPIMRDTLEFFMSLNITVTEIYGMSESSGPHTVSFPWDFRLTSCGKELPGCYTKLDNPDKDGNGEVCMGGRHVFMGYLNQEEKTTECVDKDGWLHSGDVGRKDEDGFLYITGRIKELLITAGGENVAPVPIEDAIKEELPIVSNAMLVGDKKKFLSILLTLRTEVDADTSMPTDVLSNPAQIWCRSYGCSARTVSQLLEEAEQTLLEAIEAGIARANKKAMSRAQCVQKWSILPRDFSIPGGELGPTMKLKRPVVHKMYCNTIENIYADGKL